MQRVMLVQCTWPLNSKKAAVIASPRKPDLEVTARYLNNEVEAVQHVHITNIPVWFGLLGDIKDGRM